MISLALTGDVMHLLDAADLRIINLECAITDNERPWTRMPKVFHFKAQPSAIFGVRSGPAIHGE
jgi:hypothetical protein